MQSKTICILLALSVLIAVTTAYYEEDEMYDMMDNDLMEKRGRRKNKGRKNKGSQFYQCPESTHCFCKKGPGGEDVEVACGSRHMNVGL